MASVCTLPLQVLLLSFSRNRSKFTFRRAEDPAFVTSSAGTACMPPGSGQDRHLIVQELIRDGLLVQLPCRNLFRGQLPLSGKDLLERGILLNCRINLRVVELEALGLRLLEGPLHLHLLSKDSSMESVFGLPRLEPSASFRSAALWDPPGPEAPWLSPSCCWNQAGLPSKIRKW